ncbi:MAG: hypothetical protein KDD37_07575 [Bdellovibrionales bacterium]|nr:hypothetical protein [Bdellovibrionales bacterium]
MILLLFIANFLIHADSVDHIQNGKYTENTKCSLCGGRILCGALSESIPFEGLSNPNTKSVLNFCFLKTSELKTISRQHKAWISTEELRYNKISPVVTKISTQSSLSKYTNEVVPTLKEKISARVNYRLENGFKLSEMKNALGKSTFDKWESENLILPLLSFESYAQIKGRDKNAYNTYVEDLFIANIDEMQVEPNAYAYFYEGSGSGAREVASKTSISSLTKEDLNKPHDYYNSTDVASFLEKIKLLPKEFCEKNIYKNIQQASLTSLKKLADNYGGDTSFDKAYYFKSLKKDFLVAIDSSDCGTKISQFLKDKVSTLPNPEIRKMIEKIQAPAGVRKPSSTESSSRKPVFCEFNIDNYQDSCQKK